MWYVHTHVICSRNNFQSIFFWGWLSTKIMSIKFKKYIWDFNVVQQSIQSLYSRNVPTFNNLLIKMKKRVQWLSCKKNLIVTMFSKSKTLKYKKVKFKIKTNSLIIISKKDVDLFNPMSSTRAQPLTIWTKRFKLYNPNSIMHWGHAHQSRCTNYS